MAAPDSRMMMVNKLQSTREGYGRRMGRGVDRDAEAH